MTTFKDQFLEICQANPDNKWLWLLNDGTWESYDYLALKSRVDDYCSFFEKKQLEPGDIVLIVLKESLDLFASFFAGVSYGVLPAYSAYPSAKQSPETFLNSIRNIVSFNSVRIVVGYREVVTLMEKNHHLEKQRFVGYYSPADVPKSDSCSLAQHEITDEAFLQFSSGTTGAKKGVRIPVSSLFNQIDAYRPNLDFKPSSKVVSWLPHYHDMGLVACMLIPFLEKVPIYMMSPFDWVKKPDLLLSAITEHQCTHLWLPNFAFGHLTKSIPDDVLGRYRLESLKSVVGCSEPLLNKTVSRFVQKFQACGFNEESLANCYAMAENTFAVTSTLPGDFKFLTVDRNSLRHGIAEDSPVGDDIACVGRPLLNASVKIVGERGEDVTENTVGEILLKTDCMLDCYHHNPEATSDAFADGWYRTGDLGFYREGELYLTGRKKDLVIVGGDNIYPQDVELILNDDSRLIPGRNVVFGVNDDRVGTEKIVVLAEAHPEFLDAELSDTRQKIFDELNVSVSELRLVPHRTLLKGTAGKISRHLNRQRYLDEKSSQVDNTSTMGGILEAVRQLLPRSERANLTTTSPLLSSGLIDSFGLVELALVIEKFSGRPLPLNQRTTAHLNSVGQIEALIAGRPDAAGADSEEHEQTFLKNRRDSMLALLNSESKVETAPFWERLINWMPIRSNWLYTKMLRFAGVEVGRNVKILGKLCVKLHGKPSNIVIGDNVVLSDGVDLRNRENGRIVLGDSCFLDKNVRLVAAREGMVHMEKGVAVGPNCVVNSGGKTVVGKFSLLASNVQINSSTHASLKNRFIKEQGYEHGTITIAEDVWIGAGASILMNTHIGMGAIVSSNSVVSGEVPPFGICAGIPAKLIRYRC